MAFRADEAARIRNEATENYLLLRPKDASAADRAHSRQRLADIVSEIGPAIDAYPSWHPLVCNHEDNQRELARVPNKECGYLGLDHTRFFSNGFITCPYGDGQRVIDSVNALPRHPVAIITAERLDVQFYNSSATPILVKCEWALELEDGMIPLSTAMPLFLEKEVPTCRTAQVAETWETMRPYILGTPHGSRSSLFINQEAGQAMKKVWESLINSGMFGPIYR